MSFFKPEIKLFLIVAAVAAVLAVGGIFLLNAIQQEPAPIQQNIEQMEKSI